MSFAGTAVPTGGAPASNGPTETSSGRPPWRTLVGGSWFPTAAVAVGLIVAWEIAAVTVLSGSRAVPRPTAVVGDVAGDLDLYWRNTTTTLRAAWPGWLVGNLVATSLGAVAVALPWLERPVLHLAVAITSLPIIALGPIFQVTLSGDAPRSALAGLAVVFTTMIGTIIGLRACDRSSLEVIHALGGGSVTATRKVRVRAALPDYFAALRISAPAAVLGAIVGEFIGGSDNGLGVALIAARASVDPARVWGIAAVATLLAGVGYALIAVTGRLLTPWAPRGQPAA